MCVYVSISYVLGFYLHAYMYVWQADLQFLARSARVREVKPSAYLHTYLYVRGVRPTRYAYILIYIQTFTT